MGLQTGTPELDRSHREGTYEGPGATPQLPLFIIPTGKTIPIPPPAGTHPGTCCDPPGKLGYFLEGGFGFTIPSSRNCCPHVALPLDLGPFLAKPLHLPGKIPLGGARGILLEPQRNGGVLPFPLQVLGRSIVVPGEGKLMGFKDMKEKGLEKHSSLLS